MKVKIIAVKKIHKTQPGGELEVTSTVANVLVRRGMATYADGQAPQPVSIPAPRRRRGRPPHAEGQPIGAVTTQDAKPA